MEQIKEARIIIVEDSDLKCDCEKITLGTMTLSDTNFLSKDLRDHDIVIYRGKRGEKILKSRWTSLGIIK